MAFPPLPLLYLSAALAGFGVQQAFSLLLLLPSVLPALFSLQWKALPFQFRPLASLLFFPAVFFRKVLPPVGALLPLFLFFPLFVHAFVLTFFQAEEALTQPEQMLSWHPVLFLPQVFFSARQSF